jgi:membrane-bound lytic murein transglycosylase D
VWGRIRSGYAIPDISNELVGKHVNWYATRPDYIARTTARFALPVPRGDGTGKRGMPTELALLPFIESAFNPQALSSANAAGMWQFVPGTGRDFNLKQDAFKDERRGILASTDAALTYLQRLYDMFGDWQLALAAYNWGEGSVQKAIKRNQAAGKPTDFESLAELMPAETRNYVPKLQAVKNIVANPAAVRPEPAAIDNTPYFTAVDKTSDIDLTVAAHLAELSVDEFKALNPQFKRPITGDEQTKILLPKENADKFHLNLAQWTKKPVDLDHPQDHQRARKHQHAGLALPHPRCDPSGQQHPAENGAQSRLHHSGAENFDQRQHRHSGRSGTHGHRRLRS